MSRTIEDLLEPSITHQLGRLLIACQLMEEAIRTSFPKVIGLSDTFGITDSLTRDWRAGQRAREAIRIINAITAHFRLPPAEPVWRLIWVFGVRTPKDDALAAREVVAAECAIWQRAKLLMEYRNQLFHGRLTVNEGEVTIQTKGSPVPFTAEEFEGRTNEVMEVVFLLTFITLTFVNAVRWLSDAKSVQSRSES